MKNIYYKPKVKAPDPHITGIIDEVLKANSITTVCNESSCPNRAECYGRGTATFMILGETCTRACKFCNVKTGKGSQPDISEPKRVANAIRDLKLKYIVITSVDRDDLKDYGSKQFENVVKEIRKESPDTKIELLTPDFKGNKEALDRVIASSPDKLAHNEETVRRLSKYIRPQSDYSRSLRVLEYYSKNFKGKVKSSLMVGLGERKDEIVETMRDLYNAGVNEITIGQYLQPTPKHYPVKEYYPPQYFEELKEIAYKIGFEGVASGILIRSSYYAETLSSLPIR